MSRNREVPLPSSSPSWIDGVHLSAASSSACVLVDTDPVEWWMVRSRRCVFVDGCRRGYFVVQSCESEGEKERKKRTIEGYEGDSLRYLDEKRKGRKDSCVGARGERIYSLFSIGLTFDLNGDGRHFALVRIGLFDRPPLEQRHKDIYCHLPC